MTKGKTIKPIRFSDELLELINAEILHVNLRRKTKRPFEFGQWVRQACIDKLKHGARSRGASSEELAELDAFPEIGLSGMGRNTPDDDDFQPLPAQPTGKRKKKGS